MISMVSAVDWDNKLTYTDGDLKVTFENTILGIDFLPIGEIGTVELKSHKTVDEWKPIGNNEMATWYDFNFDGEYTNGIGDLKIVDMNTGEEVERDYSFFYSTIEETDVYGVGDCKTLNKTGGCELLVVDQRNETTWHPYNSKDILQ